MAEEKEAPQSGVIQHVSSHKYIHPKKGKAKSKPGTLLVIHSDTDDWQNRLLFKYTPADGYIQHISSGLYIRPNDHNPPFLLLGDAKDENAKWDVLHDGRIQHRASKNWWHPKGGKAHPGNETKLCLDGSLKDWEDRLKWTFRAQPDPPHCKKIDLAYSRKKIAGSQKSSVSIRAINDVITIIPIIFPQAKPLLIVKALITALDKHEDAQNIKKCMEAANLKQTTMEQMAVVEAAESVMKNESAEEDFHATLKAHLVNLKSAEQTLHDVASEKTNILSVQSWIYAAGLYLTICSVVNKDIVTMNKYGAEFVGKGSAFRDKLMTHISGKREESTNKVSSGAGMNIRIIYEKHISCEFTDTLHNIREIWYGTNKEPKFSRDSLVQMAKDYVLEKSKIQEAIQSWNLIATMK